MSNYPFLKLWGSSLTLSLCVCVCVCVCMFARIFTLVSDKSYSLLRKFVLRLPHVTDECLEVIKDICEDATR